MVTPLDTRHPTLPRLPPRERGVGGHIGALVAEGEDGRPDAALPRAPRAYGTVA